MDSQVRNHLLSTYCVRSGCLCCGNLKRPKLEPRARQKRQLFVSVVCVFMYLGPTLSYRMGEAEESRGGEEEHSADGRLGVEVSWNRST